MAADKCTHFNGIAAGASQEIDIAVSTSKTAGVKLFALLNPERVPVIVKDVTVHITTGASAACTIDIGDTASDATSDNLIDGISVNAPANTVYDNHTDGGTNGKTRQYLDVGDYVTGYVASGDANGLVAEVFVNFQLLSGGQPPFP